ncbi:DNA polymerase [Aphelenchoides besseyi]|nr:DNA polymerase [Aphelenchoides besseyi]
MLDDELEDVEIRRGDRTDVEMKEVFTEKVEPEVIKVEKKVETGDNYGRRPLPSKVLSDQKTDSVRLRIIGVTREGSSVCCSILGYVPYFFIQAPVNYNGSKKSQYVNMVNAEIKEKGQRVNNNVVRSIEEVHGLSLMNYTDDTSQMFLKVNITSPKMIHQCKLAFCTVFNDNALNFFETNIDFEIRFMTDLRIVGCCWVEAPARRYSIMSGAKETTCQVEISIYHEDLISYKPTEDPWSDIAPLRTLSFDIECISRPGVFPEPDVDAIIQIACICMEQGSNTPLSKVVFVLNGCADMAGIRVVSCKTEIELLRSWGDYVRDIDPDILTGYNIQNFDIPYIMDRAKYLQKISKNDTHKYLTQAIARVNNSPCHISEMTTTSNQMGTRTNKRITLNGRIVFDVYQVIRREFTLRSYTLNNVSYHFLEDQKEDVPYQIITRLHEGTDEERRRLAMYCYKDAELPIRLLEKLLLIVNYIEMARVTGVPLNFLIARGQQVRILSQLLRKAQSMDYFLPAMDQGDTESSYEGATVIEPIRNFYTNPIATLDFASLYPSIMIAHNLCYSTCLVHPPSDFVENIDYIKTPSNNYFATPKRKRGLLPMILEDLLSARKKAKSELKVATDTFKQMVLNSRQLALKISANSVYGFTGATVGKLPCLEISSSVTAFGREMIEKTKSTVESTYKKGSYNMTKDAVVIYGDTDSVMVDFHVKTVAEAMEFGKHASELISKSFVAPIKLEFEKASSDICKFVYWPYLLISKKRYAGVYYTKPDAFDKIDTKGMETIRRDNCPLVGDVMSSCLDLMLLNHDPEGALEYAQRVISQLLMNEIDTSLLIISKELTKESYTAKQAHSVLAERMRKRDPGSAPKLGDRVPFVYAKKVPAYDKAEDPIYVLKNKLPIDVDYYLENQLMKPLCRLFEGVYKEQTEQKLMQGKHARVRAVPVSKTVGMGQFLYTQVKCLMCRAVIPANIESPVCRHCMPKVNEIYIKKVRELRDTQQRFGRFWTECQNCSEDFTDEIKCGANDCPIFYMREKARVDLEEKSAAFRRFECLQNF